MRSQGRSNKRHHNRANKSEEHTALNDDRSWSSHADYRQPHRASYTDSSSSRLHHDSESWQPDNTHDVYDRNESYRSNDIDFRPSESWSRSGGESHRFQPRDTWPQRTPPWTSSYPQLPAWSKRNSASYEDRSSLHGNWQRDDNRTHPVNDRRHDDRHSGRDQWRNDHRADRRWQNDSEWDSRRRDEATYSWDEPKRPSHDEPVEDRSWEPAASWKASNRSESQAQHNQPEQRNSNPEKSSRSGKKFYSQPRQRERDWRHDDDGHFNNWQRRDNRNAAEKPNKSNRKHHSYSRSRSPSESQYSRFSSKGRSKSRSLSPAYKRRKRDPSPSTQPSPFSPDRGRSRYHNENRHSVSPPPQQARNARGRSTSSTSSRSSDRSPSSTGQLRAVHRLPTASDSAPVSDISRPTNTNHTRNGKNQANGRNKRSNQSRKQNTMPPPSVPMPLPAFLPPKPTFEMPDPRPPTHVFTEAKSDHPPRSTPVKISTGFRPINFTSSTSSSLRKFFPGDDDDIELVSTPVVPVQEPAPAQEPQTWPHSPVREPSPKSPPGFTPPQPLSNTQPKDDTSLVPSPVEETRERSVTIEATVSQPEEPSPQVEPRGELYAIVSQVGEGTFGKVYKARNTITNMHVALKRIRMEAEKDGFPVTAMREIKLLQSLRHPNVVNLYEMMVSHGTAYMVLEYMDHDLTGILSQSQFAFSPAHLKSLCHQMLAGLAYLHHKGVIHRDIKGSNILINNRGELKLGDFGLARFYQKRRRTDHTNRVITLWYRSPELLFGATEYGPEVDMWSAGCIMLELFTKKPVFQGNDEIHQLDVIYKVIGSPTPERWPGIINLPWYELLRPKDVIPDHFRGLFQKWMSSAALDLAQQLLSYDPGLRWSATQAMEAPYFLAEEPSAERPTGLATLEGEWHELETKRERAKKRKKE